jgi:hypothetical protein
VAPTPPPREPGAIPFDFPRVQTVATKEGDFVLNPSRQFIDNAFEKGADRQSFIFYSSKMVQPGEYESKVRAPGQDVVIPNALIIPIRSGETAQPGDIVLTWWQSGSGMQRAVVVEGGTPEAPAVRYLDIDLDNPSGAGERVDTIKANSFHKLTGEWQSGTALACKTDAGLKHGLLITATDDKVLVLGFAGRMKVQPRASCMPLPIVPQVKVGQQVWVENMGGFREATVTKIDAAIGRVFSEYDFVGEKRQIASPFGDVSPVPLP